MKDEEIKKIDECIYNYSALTNQFIKMLKHNIEEVLSKENTQSEKEMKAQGRIYQMLADLAYKEQRKHEEDSGREKEHSTNKEDEIRKIIKERKSTLIEKLSKGISEIVDDFVKDEFIKLGAELSCLINDECKNTVEQIEENTIQKTRINEDTDKEEHDTRERLTIPSTGNECELKDLCVDGYNPDMPPIAWRCDKYCEKHLRKNETCSGCAIKKAIDKLACYENAEERLKEFKADSPDGLMCADYVLKLMTGEDV